MYVNRLKVKHSDNAVFKDLSVSCASFRLTPAALPLVKTEDYLYVGRYKPFSRFFVEVSAVNSVDASFTAQYWTGTEWAALELHTDGTGCLVRPGFIDFELPTDWAAGTVDTEEAFWIRLAVSASLTSTTAASGISLVYAEDGDLVRRDSEVMTLLGTNQVTFILTHEAARDDIIQRLKNDGKFKVPSTGFMQEDIDYWDLLNTDQIKVAATYLALALIHLNASDTKEDIHDHKYGVYNAKYEAAMKVFYLTLDTDDSGTRDESEASKSQTGRLVRGSPQY